MKRNGIICEKILCQENFFILGLEIPLAIIISGKWNACLLQRFIPSPTHSFGSHVDIYGEIQHMQNVRFNTGHTKNKPVLFALCIEFNCLNYVQAKFDAKTIKFDT